MATSTIDNNNLQNSQQIYSNIQSEINDANSILTALTQQQAQYQEQVQMYQDQLTFTKTDFTYVTSLEQQIAVLRTSLKSYIAFLSTRTQPLTYAQAQLDPAIVVLNGSDTVPGVYQQLDDLSQVVYQIMFNINYVNDAVANTYDLLMNYNAANSPTKPQSALPPNPNLAPVLKTCMDSGLTALEAYSNIFLELIDFMMQIQALTGLTNYLTDGFNSQITALNAIEAHLAYRFKNDFVNTESLTLLLKNAQRKLADTNASIASINLDLGLLNVESAAALNSYQGSGNLLT